MMTRRAALTSVAALVLGSVPAVRAADREYWKHEKGHFENTSGNKWIEKTEKHTYHFVEKDRKEKYVELYDKTRDISVRLYDHHCDVKKGDGKFEKYYEGKWGKR